MSLGILEVALWLIINICAKKHLKKVLAVTLLGRHMPVLAHTAESLLSLRTAVRLLNPLSKAHVFSKSMS